MRKKEWLAMLLAGGQGRRLGVLTKELAKPAVPFGGKYRIIDFALSNCYNSGIDTVGVLTQYQPLTLHAYIGIGSPWDLDRKNGGVFILPPYQRAKGGEWYKGTADAIWQNMNFIRMFNVRHVLVLSGDHIYKMDYASLLGFHKEKGAEATIAVIGVPWAEASRFGIMHTAADGRIVQFQEKPKKPQSNLASMGVYIFDWEVLEQYLAEDAQDRKSAHDFGKNIIPKMLDGGRRLFAYPFEGYWKDVGTIESYWEANMDLLADDPPLDLNDPDWRIYSVSSTRPPHYAAPSSQIRRAIIGEGCAIYGEVEHSVLFPDVYIGKGAKVRDSVLLPHVRIEDGASVERAIIGWRTVIGSQSQIGGFSEAPAETGSAGITVVDGNLILPPASRAVRGTVLGQDSFETVFEALSI